MTRQIFLNNEILPIVGSNQNGNALSEMSNIEEVNQMKDLVMWDTEQVKPVWGYETIKNNECSWLNYFAIFVEKTTALICTE